MSFTHQFRRSATAVSLAVAGLLGAVSQADAASVIARLDVTPSTTVTRTISNSAINTGATTVSAGQFTLTRIGGDYAGSLVPSLNQFIAYCLEAQEGITPGGTYTFEVADLSLGADNIGGIGAVRANFLRELVAAVNPQNGLDAVAAAAFQVAVWEIARETPLGTFNVTSGNTTFTNATAGVLTQAQTWLDTYINDGVQGALATNVVALLNQDNQDLMAFVQVPEPASVALLAAGFVGVGAARRRRA